MKDLKSTKALVKFILENDERTRNSDSYLYLKVINEVADEHGIDLNKVPVTDYLINMSKSIFPSFETVRRTRQKIQAECPELAACDFVKECRTENEAAYREFARK